MDLNTYQALGDQMYKTGIFIGCNINRFADTSQIPLNIAKDNGLTPDTNVVEIGCGCCRVGYWFIDYLNPGKYYGIEPNVEMLNMGKEILLPDVINDKLPTFDNNENFDLSVFTTAPDMIIAFSIWSHATKSQIETILNQMSQLDTPVSFIGTIVLTNDISLEYNGDGWVGQSHESRARGIVYYTSTWLKSICEKYNLELTILNHTTVNQQWIKITNNK